MKIEDKPENQIGGALIRRHFPDGWVFECSKRNFACLKDKIKCDFYGCNSPQSEEPQNGRMKFCEAHLAELNAHSSVDFRKVIAWWIKANGGAKRLAETM